MKQVLLRVLLPSSITARVLVLQILFLAVLSAALIPSFLQKQLAHDEALLMYAGQLMSQGWMPYRDFFETSMPVSLLVYKALYLLAKAETLPARLLELGLLFLFSSGLYALLHRLDRRAALTTALAFFTFYLVVDYTLWLQRDWLGCFPLLAALILVLQSSARFIGLRLVMIGLLFGLAAGIKPHLILPAPLFVLFAFHNIHGYLWPKCTAEFLALFKAISLSLSGFLLPLAGLTIWLWLNQSLAAFVWLVFNYLPLHIQQTGDHTFLSAQSRFIYSIRTTLSLGPYPGLFIGLTALAVAAPSILPDHDERRRLAILLLATSGLYLIYPGLAGQFWPYHYWPLITSAFLATGFALCLLQSTSLTVAHRKLAGLALASLITFPLLILPQVTRGDFQPMDDKEGLVNHLTKSLKAQSHPGKRVLVWDWTGGGLHAAMRAGLKPATRFLYNYHFLHHVSRPEIQSLRQEFLTTIQDAPPHLILIVNGRAKVKGLDTELRFEPFEDFVGAYYVEIEGDARYRLLQRRILTND